ncbi:DNA double-strand break repair Rad50 ATPase [uncultured archaeon]|nr:DNA double-strand break repair Rad50 ATPase [uncultured archaeon]
MLIKSVELKNVKSYHHETIEFLEGINGICGQNGHGKSTILESIGYALFDYQPYKKIEDFRRHCEKSGFVAVTVEGKDEIEYTIYRKLGGSDYYIKTPVSEIKGKKDVTAWIASNLLNNVRSPEDMPSIFENAVGVPQGTFTTAFLLNPEPRKKIFDNILRVEEYKTAYTNLRDVITAIEKTIDSMDRELIPLRTRTEKYPELKKDKERLQKESDELRTEIKEINIKIKSLTTKKEEQAGKKAQLDALSSQIVNERIRLDGTTKQLDRAKSDLFRAESAQKIVNEQLPAEELFKKESAAIKELDKDRRKRDRLKEDIARLDSDIRILSEKLERIPKLSSENKELEELKKQLIPAVEKQKALEDEIQDLLSLLDSLIHLGFDLKQAVEKEQRANLLNSEIQELEKSVTPLIPLIGQQTEFENRQQELLQRQASVKSMLEKTRKNMKLAGTQGACPVFNGIKCTSVNDFAGYFDDEINMHTGMLNEIKTQLDLISKSLSKLENPRKKRDDMAAIIESKKKDLGAYRDISKNVISCRAKLEKLGLSYPALKVGVLTGSEEERKSFTICLNSKKADLKALNSPDKEFGKLNGVEEKNLKELKSLENVPGSIDLKGSEREMLATKSLIFDGLDEKIVIMQDKIDKLEPEHNKYLQALPLALKVSEYAEECRKLERIISSMNSNLSGYIQKHETLLSEFDEPILNETISQLEELGKILSSKAEAIKGKTRSIEKLSREIAVMESELLKINDVEKKLENEKQFLSFSNFIRDTIKNSSEYIVNEFIGEISQDAGNIYSEIMDDFTCGLKWQNDYDIEIESAGEIKSFRQLSGGERMSAALAVRLALLKALSSCDFIFLDEPTQNMDEIRREKLSQEIMNIRGFKQIFVISHDDTFNEKYANVIKIEKTDGESRVVSCST